MKKFLNLLGCIFFAGLGLKFLIFAISIMVNSGIDPILLSVWSDHGIGATTMAVFSASLSAVALMASLVCGIKIFEREK